MGNKEEENLIVTSAIQHTKVKSCEDDWITTKDWVIKDDPLGDHLL